MIVRLSGKGMNQIDIAEVVGCTIEDIDHTKTKAKSPQTNGICERFHRTLQDEFYAIVFRKKVYQSIEELKSDLDRWMHYYNHERTHSGKHCYGKTPIETFADSKKLAREKIQLDSSDNPLTCQNRVKRK